MEQTSATTTNPVFSVDKNGCVLYSNDAGNTLLNEWGVRVGEKLPSSIGDLVQRVISRDSPEKMEVKVGNRIFLVVFSPLPEQELVSISGFDISDKKEFEEKLRIKEKQNDVLHRIGKIALGQESLQTFMDESVKLIADILELEYCKIMELLPDGKFLMRAGTGWKSEFVGKNVVEGEKGSQAGYTLFSGMPVIVEDFEEENRFEKPEILKIHGVKSGASVVIGSKENIFGVLVVNSTKKRKFASDDTYFLNSVAFLISQVVERKKAEEALLESESNRKVAEATDAERQRFFDMLEALPVMICLLTPDYHIAFANRLFRKKFGESNSRHCYESCFGLNKPCDFCEAYKVLETGKPHHWEVTTPDGSIIDAYDLPFTDIDGSPLILEMDIDITERKKTEIALANIEIARQKEIHHRIKNNLQVISSLLDLQADKFNNRELIKYSEVLEAFKESQNRVISMALIHEELHKGERLGMLNFSSYIEELADSLLLTYILGNNDISLNTDLDQNIFFDMDIAIPLGIIINELVSNSFKYAFSNRDKGEIRIKLHREEGKRTAYILSVSDNGVGIPEDLDVEDLDSLGLQLVTTLVDQLDGELELNRDNGTEFIIRFGVTGYNDKELPLGQMQLADDD